MDLVNNLHCNCKYLGDILYIQAFNQPKKTAVIYKEQEYSYQKLYQMALGLSNRITSLIPNPKSIGILINRSIEYLIAYFAITISGAMIVPIDPNLTDEEIKSTLEYCQAELLLYDASKDLISLNIPSILITDNEFENYVEYSRGTVYTSKWSDNSDVALLLHTSGSIDNPKRVMLTHRNIICNARSHAKHMRLLPQHRVFIALPMHFGYCNTAQIITHLLLGGTLIILDGIFSPHRFFKILDKYKFHVFTGVPTMLIQLVNFNHAAKYVTSSLLQITFGGAPCPIKKLLDFKFKFPHVFLCQTYGQTEAGPRVTGVLPEPDANLQSVGTAIPDVQIRIEDEDGNILENQEVGQIVVKSPGVMKGYFRRQEETDKVLKNGWLYTGDLGYLNHKGELFIVGRLKNIIIRAGVNIYPEEIETYLMRHPKVKEVLVFGVNHADLGEVPHAKVIRAGHTLTLEELQQYAISGLAKAKIPIIHFVDELPRTYNKKIKRCKVQ